MGLLLGVDVGGTFTDAALIERGALHTAKVASTPQDQSRGVLEAVTAVLEAAGAAARDVERFAHGMTVATNALLEGKAARTALLATAGFTDVIELGRQARPELYRLCAGAPAPLVPAQLRFAVPEREGPHATIEPLRAGAARELVQEVARAEPEAVAVALLHSYRDPAHERELGALLGELVPAAHVSLSAELVGTFREYERTATTVLDAALSPLLAAYLRGLSEGARGRGLREPLVMQSSGGLVEAGAAAAHAALTVLSGPAGGVAGARMLARLAGEPEVLCFDMGGTSCDVCVIEAGEVAESAERVIAGRPLALPALDIHTVGAGGGSIAWRDSGGALRVGPQSAGARPGPACYGRGGELPTVTDANLLLGRLREDAPLAGGLALRRESAGRAVGALARELGMETRECAEGIVRVAETEMLGALRVVTVERGLDPRGFALMPFGGAGPLHAASMAAELGMETVLCPGASGVLSALGLAAAAPRRDASRTVLLRLEEAGAHELASTRAAVLEQARAGLAGAAARTRVTYELRYCGQSFELPVTAEEEHADLESPGVLAERFARAHERRYGYREQHAAVELVNIRASVWGEEPELRVRAGTEQPRRSSAPIVFAGRELEATVLHGAPPPGERVSGPALCALAQSTLLVPPGWWCEVDRQGTARLQRSS